MISIDFDVAGIQRLDPERLERFGTSDPKGVVITKKGSRFIPPTSIGGEKKPPT